MEGEEIGGYALVRRLGSGGAGTVWLAEDGGGQRVALKLVHPALAASEGARRRLEREAATVNSVRSDRVAHVVDVETDASQPFIASEYVEGPTLASLIRSGPLEPSLVAALAADLVSTIRAVHEARIVHRDIKPSNIICSTTGPVLIDFGIAMNDGDEHFTRTGLVSGTAGYTAPELLRAQEADDATDWWAWCATLLSASTGRPPYGTGDVQAVIMRVLTGDPDLAGVDAPIAEVLRRGLSPDPTSRPAPAEVVAALVGAAGLPGGAPSLDVLDWGALFARAADAARTEALRPPGADAPVGASAEGPAGAAGSSTHSPSSSGAPFDGDDVPPTRPLPSSQPTARLAPPEPSYPPPAGALGPADPGFAPDGAPAGYGQGADATAIQPPWPVSGAGAPWSAAQSSGVAWAGTADGAAVQPPWPGGPVAGAEWAQAPSSSSPQPGAAWGPMAAGLGAAPTDGVLAPYRADGQWAEPAPSPWTALPAPTYIPNFPRTTWILGPALLMPLAMLPILLGAIGSIAVVTALLLLALVGACLRHREMRRVRNAGPKGSDTAAMLAASPLLLLKAAGGLVLSFALGAIIPYVAWIGYAAGGIDGAPWRRIIEIVASPRPTLGADPLVTDPIWSIALWVAVWAALALTWLMPTAVDLRDGTSRFATALLGPTWIRFIAGLLCAGVVVATWFIVTGGPA